MDEKRLINGGFLLRGSVAVIALIAVAVALRATSQIFLPLVIALLFSFAASPIVRFLDYLRFPRALSIAIVMLIFLAFSYLAGLVLSTSIRSLLNAVPEYQARILIILEDITDRVPLIENLLDDMNIGERVSSALFSLSGNFVSFSGGLLLMLLFMLFIMIEEISLDEKLVEAFQSETAQRIQGIARSIFTQISNYLGVRVLMSIVTGAVVYVLFLLIGVDFPFVWGVLAFLFNFIPSIGSILISILATLFAVVQFAPQWNMVIIAGASISLTEMIIGNIIEPNLLGDRLNMSPLVIMLSLMFWGWLWGVPGTFLAVPIMVAIRFILLYIPATRPIGILLAGRSRAALLRREKVRAHRNHNSDGKAE